MLEKVKATFKEKPSPQKSNLHRELEKVLPEPKGEKRGFFEGGEGLDGEMPIHKKDEGKETTKAED